MDAGILTEDGNIAVMARSDDVINVAGHRLSTGALEEVLWTPSEISFALLHISNYHIVKINKYVKKIIFIYRH